MGFPLSRLLSSSIILSEGLKSNLYGINDDPRMFQVSVSIQPGNSGSPLFNSDGMVIGVITSTLNNKNLFQQKSFISQNVNFAVKISYLENMLSMIPGWSSIKNTTTTFKINNAKELNQNFLNSIVVVESLR